MHWNNTVSTSPERWKCGPSLKQHWVSAPRCSCVTEQFKLTGQVARSKRVFTNTIVHSAISECHSHPLRFCVALTHIQHHGSLSSVTSPSANQQPAVHKWAISGEVDRDWPVVFKCTPAHPLPTHGNLCTQCSSYKPEGIHECSTFNFIFIDN